MSSFDFDKYKEIIKDLGEEAIRKIIEIMRPHLPWLLSDADLLKIAIIFASAAVPFAIGSGIAAVDILSKVSLFGLNTGIGTVKLTYGIVKATAQIATDILIKKPIYLLTYPFRKAQRNKEVIELLQHCKIQPQERQHYKATYSQAIDQPDKLFLIIRQIGSNQQNNKDIKVLIGSLDVNDRVDRLLPLIRKNGKDYEINSIQLICNRTMLRLDSRLSDLPRNNIGAIEIYYVVSETFG